MIRTPSRTRIAGTRPETRLAVCGEIARLRVEWLRVDRCVGLLLALTLLLILSCHTSLAAAGEPSLETVHFLDQDAVERRVSGQILLEAQDGGILVLGRDGRLWNVTPQKLQSRRATQSEFTPLSAQEQGTRLLAEMGADFRIVSTRHYVICTNAAPAYARWCGALFERLLTSFLQHWRRDGLDLREPEFPLVALVFRSRDQFAAHAAAELGPEMSQAKGYYSVLTNRIVLFDLTAESDGPVRSSADISDRLSNSLFNVATVVHEATHQVAYNTGLHTRLADNPVWLVEGLAMYFETPDLRSRSGWRSLGKPNPFRMSQLRTDARRREPFDLQSLMESDADLNDPESAATAYARAWALTYFLIKSRRDQFAKYLKMQQRKPPLQWQTEAQRVAEFESAFGPTGELRRDLARYMARVR